MPKLKPPNEPALSPELPVMNESGAKYWSSTSLGDLLPELEPPKDVGPAHEYMHESQVEHGQQPNAGPPGPGPSNAVTRPSNSLARPATTLDSDLDIGVSATAPTDRLGTCYDGVSTTAPTDRPGPRGCQAHRRPQRPTRTGYPSSAVHPPSPGAGSSTRTVPELEVGTPPPPPNERA